MPQARATGPEPQAVAGPLTASAIFLVLTINPGDAARDTARSVVADVGSLVRAVGFRSLHGNLTCAVGIGSQAWDRFGARSRPAQLHEFIPLRGDQHEAPSTPGDLLFHIRAERLDLCFELERLLLDQLGDAVAVVDETHSFRYFDTRDLLGFVDGTENPTGQELVDAVFIGDEDPEFAGGSYAIVQKYTHDLDGWQQLSTEHQELIIGRTKIDDVELPDDVQPPDSHVALNTIEDEDGNDRDILRGNMPFGTPGSGEVGLYYIGYARDVWVTEQMLRNMFIGNPPGLYDKVLDFSTAVTGTNFFVPSLELLESLADLGDGGEDSAPEPGTIAEQLADTDPTRRAPGDTAPPPAKRDGSLGIGSLQGGHHP
ncbi:Dyp-type peroxidase [Segeticoccus rhizosphaerae]|jgi:putative iron-dependent peroxidase|uniref:Dyp-type peroxidase n=1 Tax=Segeticoccus rhizosphaerae TaxID=1104777 RepID=UPI0010C0A8FF|nr:Dyp-type peroxidase [Ornithinicoccus soli]